MFAFFALFAGITYKKQEFTYRQISQNVWNIQILTRITENKNNLLNNSMFLFKNKI